MSLNIHKSIKEKLAYFHQIHKIPNIIFNGASGSGKSTIVNDFISLIYDGEREKINNFVMYVNCAHGKGIKFIRDELKFFAKTHINSNGGNTFKSIVLLNGDKLTMDAQSALRRCIELFSHNTRFFIIVEDKYKLLKPILSRFCEIYIPEPVYKGQQVNLYKYNLDAIFKLSSVKTTRIEWLKRELQKTIKSDISESDLFLFITKLYEKGYSALDLIKVIENGFQISNNLDSNKQLVTDEKRYELLVAFNKVRKEIRNEKIIIMFIINFTFLDSETVLENLAFA
jgi:DNA polymerase III delta prime subunit